MEPGTFECRMFMWNLGNLGEPELYVEALWALEPLNLGEPELLRLEHLCGALGFQVSGGCPNHPETLLEKPQAFQAVGEKHFQKDAIKASPKKLQT